MDSERLWYIARTYRWIPELWRYPFVPDYPVDRPIFLLGTQGGGLSLLSRMLRRHPLAVSGGGNSDYWTSSDEIANIFGLLLPADFAGLRFKAPPHPVLSPPRSWTYACDDLLPAYRRVAADARPDLRRRLLRTLRFAIAIHARDPRRCRFVDKSQTTTVRVGLFHALLRDHDPRFVLVTRDPYVSVYRAANGRAGDIKRLSDRLDHDARVRLCSEHYMNSMRAVLADIDAGGPRVHCIRFEDLLHEPAATLQEVCRFADLSFDASMLPHPEHRLPRGSRFRERWWPLRSDVNDPYWHRIGHDVIEQVNRLGTDVIERLGYAVKEPR